MERNPPVTAELVRQGLRPAGDVAPAWRRGIMHAVEVVDLALASKGSLSAKIDAVRSALDGLTDLQRDNAPETYAQAFAICDADRSKRQDRAA